MSTSGAATPSCWKGKGSNERPSSTGVCNIATPLPKNINQVSQSLRYFRPHPVSNHLTTDTLSQPKTSTRKCRAWGMAGGYMAQTRSSPTLSRGFTRLDRFLAPYGSLLRDIVRCSNSVRGYPSSIEKFRVSSGFDD